MGPGLVLLISALLTACGDDAGGGIAVRGPAQTDRLSGDATPAVTTTAVITADAFSQPLPGLSAAQQRTFAQGARLFDQVWGAAAAVGTTEGGLGPTFLTASCAACHGNNGRARPPLSPDDATPGLLLRLSRASAPGDGRPGGPDVPDGVAVPVPDPTYGTQLQDHAVAGVAPEGRLVVTYVAVSGAFPDGEPYTLLQPTYAIADPAFGPLPADVMRSPRLAPAVVGVGLLAAIPETAILAHADPDDTNRDGISGRPNRVWDTRRQAFVLGRFGWKANQPTLEQQIAAAFWHDLGLTSSLFPEQNCPAPQAACRAAPDGGLPEVRDAQLDAVMCSTQALAVPAARAEADPAVRLGAELFFANGCAACHVPEFRTGPGAIPALSDQRIRPYTDLLLHDLGDALADGRPDFAATGREWRTPPLWGIGLVETVNGHTRFLHDGRARSLQEAILWHGGEGAAARDAFMALSQEERAALIRFLESL